MQEQDEQVITKEMALQMIDQVTSEYINLQIYAAKLVNPELKELNFVNRVIEFPNGGKYLMQLVHIEGPKVQLMPEVKSTFPHKLTEEDKERIKDLSDTIEFNDGMDD